MEIEVDMPLNIGGGSFVMRELTAGEFEDALKRATREGKGDKAADAVIDMQSDQVVASLVRFKGVPVPQAGAEKEEFRRSLTTRQWAFLNGIWDKMHTIPEKEIG